MTDDDLKILQGLTKRVGALEAEVGELVEIAKEISANLGKLDSIDESLATNFSRLYVHTRIGEKVLLGAAAQDRTVQKTQELLERMEN